MSRTIRKPGVLARGAFAVIASAVALPVSAQQRDFSQVQVETRPVAPGIYMLVGAGGNIGVSAGDDGVFIIDDQYAPLAPKIVAALAKLSPKPARFVINTHWHGDHVGGNEAFGAAGAVIVAHGNVRKRMSVAQLGKLSGRETPASPPGALPVVTFTQDVYLHLNGDDVHVFHVPNAHTDGDAFVHFTKSDVMHLGDVLFMSGYPFIDYDSGGSIDGAIAALDRALELIGANTRVIPGHGALASRKDVLEYRQMLATIRERVTAAIKAGQTIEQFLASNPTQEFDARWGNGFMKPADFARGLYRGITGAGGH